jgi:polyribonucleotide nucleotidyltransferase
MVAMIAMSAALILTGAPFEGPVAGVRVGLVAGQQKQLKSFASSEELDSGLDLVVAGTKTGIMMVEAGANEVSETQIVEALEYAHEVIQPAIKLQEELAQKVGVVQQEYELSLPDTDIQQRVETWLAGKLGAGLRMPYPERNDLVRALREQMYEHFANEIGDEFE